MFDVIDRACQHAEEVLERRIAEHVNRPVSISAFECEDCGEPIPEIRRIQVIGCSRCVDCQSDFELINKHYRSI
ncbi:TraR/DksA family transcriptional regulator [Xenorhabdus cabanillasii]|uniref:Uncharacterized 8.5 kDa protein in gpA 5'region n=1 Tax=Xenorhabdus cabanillasii JM26 TaxID=1427517 RepID=W1IRK3_9GAMM|nr:TraR/DksA family transcriptional regulator [Xenorhabdus cabanillasii]PHM76303.1 hypothetical protein Xcab_03214 [Xenorhabdus cabanillasii JM26]CDL80443.1 Uncharacterized 8.5 kDa protein in gpA 5'region [Xenorhabdus cabanillasii JM26]